MEDLYEVRKLLGCAQIPEKNEAELLKNFKTTCPPEVRNVAAFRVISHTLHVTEEVVRERTFAMTADSDLSNEDKRLVGSYNIFMDFQMSDPGTMIHMLGRNEAYTQLLTQSGTGQATSKSGRKKSVSGPSDSDTRKKSNGHIKLKIRNGSVFHANEKQKTGILKTIFRPSSGPDEPPRVAEVTLKSCFVKVFRLSKKKLSSIRKPRKSVTFTTPIVLSPKPLPVSCDDQEPGLEPLTQRKPMPLSKQLARAAAEAAASAVTVPIPKPRSRSNSVKRCSDETLAKLDEILDLVIQNSTAPPSPAPSTPPPQVSPLQVPINEPVTIMIDEVPPMASGGPDDQPLVTMKSPVLQEFSMFDVTTTPKKAHKRPLIYDETYRRRLSSITSDDEKLTTAVVCSLLSPPVVGSGRKGSKVDEETGHRKKHKKSKKPKPQTDERGTSVTPEKLEPRPIKPDKARKYMEIFGEEMIPARYSDEEVAAQAEFNDLVQTPAQTPSDNLVDRPYDVIFPFSPFDAPNQSKADESGGPVDSANVSQPMPSEVVAQDKVTVVAEDAVSASEKSKPKIPDDTPQWGRKKKWRKSGDAGSSATGATTRAKTVETKYNGKFTGDRNFRVPISYHTAAALARKVSSESDLTARSELDHKIRRESYNCHWDKNPERKKSMELYGREKWYSTVTSDVNMPLQQAANWRRLSKNDNYPAPPAHNNPPSIPEYPPPPPPQSMGYFQPQHQHQHQHPHPSPKTPERRYSFGMSSFFSFPDIMTPSGGEKFSSELTTFNLISDAITSNASSPTSEVVYPVHGVDYGSVIPKPHTGRVEADVYFSPSSSESNTTSMYVDDAIGFYEVFAS